MTTIVLKQTPILDLFRLIANGRLRFDARVSFILLRKLVIVLLTPFANLLVFVCKFVACACELFGEGFVAAFFAFALAILFFYGVPWAMETW